jgi:hypothetical protein
MSIAVKIFFKKIQTIVREESPQIHFLSFFRSHFFQENSKSRKESELNSEENLGLEILIEILEISIKPELLKY